MKIKRALTEREVQIFSLVKAGKTNSEIADHLHISVKTVEAHKHNVLIKVGANSAKDLKQYKLQNLKSRRR